MTIPKFDQLSGSETLPELIEMVAKLQKQVQWLMDGKISSDNVREIAGYRVDQTDLMSADGDVGLSSANDAIDPIRIWAGAPVKEAAPFRVPKSGKMVATGATIESQGNYPKVTLNPEDNYLMAAQDAKHYVVITPFDGNTPAIQIVDEVNNKSLLLYVTATGVSVSATGDLFLSANGGAIKFPNWSNMHNTSNGQTLQQALDAAMASPSPAPPPTG